MARLAALVLACAALPGIAAEPCRESLPEARMIGQGEYRWLGLRVYVAQLWMARAPVSGGAAAAANSPDVLQAPFALRLIYARDIPKQRLVETSIDEIRRIYGNSLSDTTTDRWRHALSRVLVDVRAGDCLTGVYSPAQGARFYANDRETGRFDDPVLAHAFFAIWLGPSTRDPALRQKLLGPAR